MKNAIMFGPFENVTKTKNFCVPKYFKKTIEVRRLALEVVFLLI